MLPAPRFADNRIREDARSDQVACYNGATGARLGSIPLTKHIWYVLFRKSQLLERIMLDADGLLLTNPEISVESAGIIIVAIAGGLHWLRTR